MSILPAFRVGAAVKHGSLTVFPLFADAPAKPADYRLSAEALADGSVTVEEVSEGGSVPQLTVFNKSDKPVLFLEGEELRGAKQNRVLNTTVLVPAGARTAVPVSCVEQGRWRYKSKEFGSSGTHASSKLRSVLKASVSRSASRGDGHGSDQGAVWQEVSRQMSSLGASSATMSMADTYDSFKDRTAEFQTSLGYIEGATGLAVAIGGAVVSIDVFDSPITCAKVWPRLLTGVIMDAVETKESEHV